MTALLRHDRDLVKKKALLVLHRFVQLDPGVAPDVEKLLIEKIGYKVGVCVCVWWGTGWVMRGWRWQSVVCRVGRVACAGWGGVRWVGMLMLCGGRLPM